MRLPLPQFAVRQRAAGHIAEVIETSTTEFFGPMPRARRLELSGDAALWQLGKSL